MRQSKSQSSIVIKKKKAEPSEICHLIFECYQNQQSTKVKHGLIAKDSALKWQVYICEDIVTASKACGHEIRACSNRYYHIFTGSEWRFIPTIHIEYLVRKIALVSGIERHMAQSHDFLKKIHTQFACASETFVWPEMNNLKPLEGNITW